MALERDIKENRNFDRADNAYDEEATGRDFLSRQLKELLEDENSDRPILSADRTTPQQQVEEDKREEEEEVLSAIPASEITAETLDRTDDDRDSGDHKQEEKDINLSDDDRLFEKLASFGKDEEQERQQQEVPR